MAAVIYDPGPGANRGLIEAFEAALGPLPPTYRRFVLESNGGCAVPPGFRYFAPGGTAEPAGVDAVELFFRFTARTNADRGVGVNELVGPSATHGHGIQSYFAYVEHFPRGLFAVGICTKWRRKLRMGYVLLSVRPEDYGAVYFWQDVPHKRGRSQEHPFDRVFRPTDLYRVAGDFAEFLAGLHWPAETEPWANAVEFGDVRAMAAWMESGGDVDRRCPVLRLNALEYACMGNIFTPRNTAVEAACTEMAALLAGRSSAPEAGLEWAGKNWLRIAAVIPHVTKLGTLRRVQKELRNEAGVLPLFTGALTAAGQAWAAQLPGLQERLTARIRDLGRKA